MKKHLWDMAVCAAVLVTAALLLCFPLISDASRSKAKTVSVIVDGEEIATLPLDRDTVFTCENGLTVTVENNCAYISFSPCPDKLCVKAGKLTRTGQSAVCLPCRTVVKLSSGGESEVDGIV